VEDGFSDDGVHFGGCGEGTGKSEDVAEATKTTRAIV
jgi:hypothetical protein